MTFAREAWPFVLPPAAAAVALALFGRAGAALAAAAAALLLLAFFRVPRRRRPEDRGALLSAANGRVMSVDRVEAPELGPGPFQRVVTFLSVFDVHLQRAPTAGQVTLSHHRPGRKLAAFRAAAGEANESHLVAIRRADGAVVGVRQIAGLLARRIVCYLEAEQQIDAGQPLGLIKFGSRVDLLIPEQFEVTVRPGQRLREGETAVARLRSQP